MVVIIGTGAGGGIIARELALAKIPVTIIEKGPFIDVKDSFDYYDESDEGVDLLKNTCVGGSTVVSAGNGVRVLEEELKEIGVEITKELDEVEKLISVHQMNDDHIGEGTKKFIEAAQKLNLNPIKMSKFIRDEDCVPCGKCAYGCPRNAKWTAQDFVKEAIENGAELLENTEVVEIAIEGEEVKGVYVKKNDDENSLTLIESNLVVLSAGAVNSAILLQRAGINAGQKLFMDSFVSVGGVLKGIGFNKEVTMNALVIGKNYVMAPHYSSMHLNEEFKDFNMKAEDILSIMVKIPDDSLGKIENGKVIKQNSMKDVRFIAEGSAVAGSILVEAGVDPSSIVSTPLRGAHPGGTAAIGEVVDNNLESEVKGLFVSDASVLPIAPGAPPILTILALSLRLSKHIKENYT